MINAAVAKMSRNVTDVLRRHIWAAPIEILFLGGIVVSLALGNISHAFASLFLFVMSFVPLILELRYKVKLSPFIHVVYVLFLGVSMFAGEVLGMYARWHPWDKVIHFSSGIVFGLFMFIWLHEQARRQKLVLSKTIYGFWVVGTMALGTVLWELSEFTSDRFFGTNTQDGSLLDTNLDILLNTVGSLIALVIVLLHLHGRRIPVIGGIIHGHDSLNK